MLLTTPGFFTESQQPGRNNFFYFLLLITGILFFSHCTPSNSSSKDPWDQIPHILNEINPPSFPDRDFLITAFGAKGNGQADCSAAFRKAIEECQQSGGGRVVVPEGVFLTGAIHLKSNVNLHISRGATVLFKLETTAYMPVVYTRFEGVECMNFSPFIYVYEQDNIAITGSGTLDGQAGPENWWALKGRTEFGWSAGDPNGDKDVERLYQMAESGVPVEERIFGEGSYLRPNFIQPYKCRNILIDSIKIIRSPMWVIHPVLCENVTIQNVKVSSHGPNNDGCNPESSKNVLIKNCFFDSGDDCIAIKSGRNGDGRRINVSSENIIIQGCTMKDGHGGVVIGSETSGGVKNVFAEDCWMDSPNLERALRIKSNSLRGGVVENIYLRNITVGEVSDAVITVNFNYGEGDAGAYTPVVRNIQIENMTSKLSRYALFIAGYERSMVSHLKITNCRFEGVREGNVLNHYTNLSLENVYINGQLQ